MGYSFPVYPHTVFIPKSMALPKLKAKELRALIDDLTLSEAQQVTAKALGWPDWFHLEQAIKSALKPSIMDDEAPDDVRNGRWRNQLEALLAIGVPPGEVESVIAQWGLTGSSRHAAARLAEIGPWGAFMVEPEEVAPGILFGECAKFDCYRLSPERQAAMLPHLRVAQWNGWYMAADHGYRVVLSFPELFSPKAREAAVASLYSATPYVAELTVGVSEEPQAQFGPSLPHVRQACAARLDEWFALSVFEAWTFVKGAKLDDSRVCVVSAIRGRDMLRLFDEAGVWPDNDSIPVRWLAVSKEELFPRLDQVFFDEDVLQARCLTGLNGYDHPPVAEMPFKLEPFAWDELYFGMCRGYAPLVKRLMPGIMQAIR